MQQPLCVIKIGGQTIDDPQQQATCLAGFSRIPNPKILVHGGGKIASQIAQTMGITSQMVDGRRITDEKMLEVVVMVYGGLINKKLVAQLHALNCPAIGLSGADGNTILAHKRGGQEIDYGWVGDIDQINTKFLHSLLDQRLTPVLAPLTHNGQGDLLNTNADTIASRTAIAISKTRPVKLIFGIELPGVLLDINDLDSVISQLSYTTYSKYRQSGEIHAGMIAKMENAWDAINQGVTDVIICHADQVYRAATNPHPAIGTQLVKESDI